MTFVLPKPSSERNKSHSTTITILRRETDMSYMCVMSTSLYNSKECDGCGKCEHRYDEPDYLDDDYEEEEEE